MLNKKINLKVWLRVRLEYWDWFQYWPPCHSILKSWKPCLVNRKRYQSLARSRISSFICSFIVYLPIHSFLQHKNISIISAIIARSRIAIDWFIHLFMHARIPSTWKNINNYQGQGFHNLRQTLLLFLCEPWKIWAKMFE